MTKVLLIAAGGAAGSTLRYLAAGWVQKLSGASFPFGTLAVNVVGCLLIGCLGAAFAGPVLIREEYRVAILVGALGGFTTFSTYAWETLSLANDGQIARALANVLLSNAVGLLAVWIGYRTAQSWWGV